MKKLYILGVVIATISLSSCNDLLDKDPLDKFTNNPTYWNNSDNVGNQCNALYNNYSGYGNGGGAGWYYFKTLSDDQASPTFTDWANINVPSSASSWSDPWVEIRRCNFIITNMKNSTIESTKRNEFEGIARLNRAWQYYQLVRMYGDVQWINIPLDPADPAVYGARISRDIVMDSVLNDLNYACATIKSKGKTTWSADMAQAMKADITLYEGTYCKYRTEADNGMAPSPERATKYLNECVNACTVVMNAGYSLNSDYKSNYNSVDLSSNPEMIFYKPYKKDIFMHSTIDYTSSSSEQSGVTKDAFDNFLFLDGKPLATTSLNTSDLATAIVVNKDTVAMSLTKPFSVRDKRLTAILDTVICIQGHSWIRWVGAPMTSSTGYNIGKFDNKDIPLYYRQNTGTNYTCAPLFWLSVVYLDFAEAKAELGTITQSDLDNSVNKLLLRAGITNGISTSPAPDPANNMNVSSLLWEIRRCRRCELLLDNWTRYWDLIRWHQLSLLDSSLHPNILMGANVSNIKNPRVAVTGNYINASYNMKRVYNSRQYFYPIPSGQLTLNPALKPNPGWQ